MIRPAPPAPDTDRPDLAALSRSAAADVFHRVFEDTVGVLHGYLAARVGRTVADDVVAETFLTAWRQRSGYDPNKAGLRAWLFGIATNLLRHHYRAEHRALRATARMAQLPDLGDDHPGRAEDRVDAQQRVRRLAAALTELPAGDRDVLLLVSIGGLSHAEVAQALDIPAGTVRSRLHRVRRWLRAHAPSVDSPESDGDD